MSIVCNIFGIPSIKKGNAEVSFPYKKAKAIFFYLLVNNHSTRDELASLFWDELSDSLAKKNLRNALYQIRSILGDDILLSSEKSLVVLNTDIITYTNPEALSEPEIFIKAYKGEFLQGFSIKNAPLFEQWYTQAKQQYKEKYIQNLYISINEEKTKPEINWNKIIKYAKLLTEVDDFDERAYQILLEGYKNTKAYSQAIESYNKLKSTLERELGIEPDEATTAIFNDVLDAMNEKRQTTVSDFSEFFGKYSQLRLLEQNQEEFMLDKPPTSFVILGEAGIGKSNLISNFLNRLDNKTVLIFKSKCIKTQKNHPFSYFKNLLVNEIGDKALINSWNEHLKNIISMMEGNEESILDLMESFFWDSFVAMFKNSNSKIILYIEDIHNMDEKSRNLLEYLLTNNISTYMIGSSSIKDKNMISKQFLALIENEKLEFISLSRWDYSKVKLFISQQLPKHMQTEALFDDVYFETQGNFLFIKYYVAAVLSGKDPKRISSDMVFYFEERLNDLSNPAQDVAKLISFFFEDTSFEMINSLSDIKEGKLIDVIQELTDKDILKESIQNDSIRFSFTHPKLRQYIYESQTEIKRRFIHNQIGDVIEKQLHDKPADMDLYHRLIFHYMRGANKVKALDYSVKSLNRYLNYSHELFPILASGDEALFKDAYMSRKQTQAYLLEIENLLKEVRQKEGQTRDVIIGEIAFLHMKGRYLIREGSYEEGTKYISEMISKSIEINDDDYALEAYKQMIYYCIQISEADKMQEYIQLALDIAIRRNYHKETGIILRFKGLYYILKKEYTLAKEVLTSSINTFTISKEVAEKYALNIAAAYNYIGEIHRLNNNYDEAIIAYEKAIEIGKAKNAYTSLMVFCINAGQAMYHKKDYDKAKEYLDYAKHCQSMVDILWKKAVLDVYLGLIYIINKDKASGMKLIKTAEIEAKKMKNPEEIGLVAWAKQEAKAHLESR